MGTTGGFEGIIASSTMAESSPASTKTKRVVGTIWYLHPEGVDAFIQQIKVGIMCGSDGRTS
jgi:hypothetical protein